MSSAPYPELPPLPPQAGHCEAIQPPSNVAGHLAVDVVKRVVHQRHEAMRACYEVGLQHDSQLTGRVSVAFTVRLDGVVCQARVGDSTDLPDAWVAECVARTLYDVVFPAPSKQLRIFYPIQFGPDEAR